jgi:hypothetical protein
MCRNIKKLRRPQGVPAEDELREAALQFVCKISGYREPSQANKPVFDKAVSDIASVSRELFENLVAGRRSVAAGRSRGAKAG